MSYSWAQQDNDIILYAEMYINFYITFMQREIFPMCVESRTSE